uniref:splicing regulatory glutamine/lysine-rich protein 1 isoform X2 n=1 Tax=Monopterus albus TaxID=43700 RepID=UPI0009B3FD88|nr:splicing regulatory glutamine/lysine-rich protein 1 isoform X2 [Monopterus albus]XP_020472537.1 splicing regulatory glutamine/lysine-rich protein 1 isoform X2 [Monopterus albus]XP_020472538.1 splicing regulatory glutamine/lysine-rich protein 1 isoform X2 [Monopterus albus]XP_020472539.1 splicing regulatory glutamine/lysine-rich protein 1 isoform X2 [Monopterus albus]XP_020472540.1 splicing regulatory glutamine/lysine-rich protein 1 isoform X2 [Monopterus albus]
MYAVFLSGIQCRHRGDREKSPSIAFTNTDFCFTGKIPEEAKALSLLAPATPVPSLIPGGGLLPIPTSAPLHNLNLPLVNRVSSGLDAAASVHSQPPLMGNVDPSKINEIRRTVYVGNLNSQTTTAEQLLEFFKQVGDVKFVRMAGDETQPTRFAFVEFVEQESVARALTFNGVMFGDRPLKVNHSNNAIVKPPELTPQAAAKELESVMKRVREAQSTIAAAIEPETKRRSSSRSRSLRYSCSRSHSRTRRKRSRSKHRTSQRSSWPAVDSHSARGSHRRRSHSRDRRRSQSRSRGHRRRSKDQSRSPRRKARSPSPKRGKRDKRKERSRDRKDRSTSRKRGRKDEDRTKIKAKPVKMERACDREDKADYESDREDSATPSEDMESSPFVQHNGSYKTNSEEDTSVGAEGTK